MLTTIPSLPTTREEVNNFIVSLHSNGELYHVDEFAGNILKTTGERMFTDSEAELLDAYFNQAFIVCDVWNLEAWEQIQNQLINS